MPSIQYIIPTWKSRWEGAHQSNWTGMQINFEWPGQAAINWESIKMPHWAAKCLVNEYTTAELSDVSICQNVRTVWQMETEYLSVLRPWGGPYAVTRRIIRGLATVRVLPTLGQNTTSQAMLTEDPNPEPRTKEESDCIWTCLSRNLERLRMPDWNLSISWTKNLSGATSPCQC